MLDKEPFTRHAAYTLWRLNANPVPGKKPLKVPVHHDGVTLHSLGRRAIGSRPAVAPNPAAPLTYAQAMEWLTYNRASGVGHDRAGEVGYLGVGFRPAGTGLACLDLDNCLTTGPDGAGQWTPLALDMMARFPGALLELSTGGTGLHIWFSYTGESPGKHGRDATGQVELYAEGQFIAAGRSVLQGDAAVDHTASMWQVVQQYWPQRTTAPGTAAPGVTANDWDDKTEAEREETKRQILSACRMLPQDSYQEWVSIGMALASLGDDGNELWHEVSSWYPGYDYDEAEHRWGKLAPDRTDYRALFAQAQRAGWVNPNSKEAKLNAAMAGLGDYLLPPTAVSTLLALNHAASVATNSIASQASCAPPTTVHPAAHGVCPPPPPSGPPAASEPVVPPAPSAMPVESLSFALAAEGAIAATLPNVNDVLQGSEVSLQLGWDEFYGCQMIRGEGQPWRRLTNEDPPLLRLNLERRGFKPISPEIMKSSLAIMCAKNKFDSAIEWARGLKWDGVPRVRDALHRYYGVPSSAYSQAVSEYLFTAMAGRCLEPGCQADMVLVLIGKQGARKTSAVRALAPTPDSFMVVDLAKRDDDLSRRMRGKLVLEWAELRGLFARDVPALRAWITNRQESWVEKYETQERTFGRRSVIIGTSNEDEILADPEGERRWLPARVGNIDLEALERDKEQLWAEGVVMFDQGGVRWREAERLALDEHGHYKVHDEWEDVIRAYLDAVADGKIMGEPVTGKPRGETPFALRDVMSYALAIQLERQDRKTQLRVGSILRKLGYVKIDVRSGTAVVKRWATVARP